MKVGTKRVIGVLAAMNVLSIFAAGDVIADDVVERANFTQLKLGAFQPTGDLDDAGYDAGPQVAVSYNRYLNRYLVVEAAVDAFGVENDSRGANSSAGSYEKEDTLSAGAILVTVKGEIPVGQANLFGGIGGGLYSVTLDSDIESSRLGDFSADDDDQVIGAHVVAGVNYDITDRFFLGVEGMYRWTDDVEITETVASIPVEYNGDLSGFSLSVNGGIRF